MVRKCHRKNIYFAKHQNISKQDPDPDPEKNGPDPQLPDLNNSEVEKKCLRYLHNYSIFELVAKLLYKIQKHIKHSLN